MTPDGAAQLVLKGHKVVIERGAGDLSGFTDQEYLAAKAEIRDTLAEVWGEAELLVKVKEPAPEELPLFRPGLAVFSFLHPAVAPELVNALLASRVIGLDYDLLALDDGRLPILEPMSVIAGKLSIQAGAFALQSAGGGRGVLLGGAPGVRPAKVVVVGAGAAGSSAARVAMGMGAQVVLLDINLDRLQPFASGSPQVATLYSSPQAIARELHDADLVIGSVLIPGALAPKLVSRAQLPTMKHGAVIVDICIDQGGFAESSHPTSIAQPTYIDTSVVHYCVPNMPALVPRTSTLALTNATFRWIEGISSLGIQTAIKRLRPLRRSVISYEGQLTNAIVADALGIAALPPDQVDKLF